MKTTSRRLVPIAAGFALLAGILKQRLKTIFKIYLSTLRIVTDETEEPSRVTYKERLLGKATRWGTAFALWSMVGFGCYSFDLFQPATTVAESNAIATVSVYLNEEEIPSSTKANTRLFEHEKVFDQRVIFTPFYTHSGYSLARVCEYSVEQGIVVGKTPKELRADILEHLKLTIWDEKFWWDFSIIPFLSFFEFLWITFKIFLGGFILVELLTAKPKCSVPAINFLIERLVILSLVFALCLYLLGGMWVAVFQYFLDLYAIIVSFELLRNGVVWGISKGKAIFIQNVGGGN